MKTDIVEDLRMQRDSFHWRAADEIERLRAENEKLRAAADDDALTVSYELGYACGRDMARAEIDALRAALQPFAVSEDVIERWFGYEDEPDGVCDSTSIIANCVFVGHLRAAAKALGSSQVILDNSKAAALREAGDE